MHLLGIDIGGTKTAVCVGNETGALRVSRRIGMVPGESIDGYVGRLLTLCRDVLSEAALEPDALDAVGICAPGAMNVGRGVLFSMPNNPGWRDVPIVSVVRDALGGFVYLNNDANACALAELHFGGHAGVRNLIYLTFSTGMGGGIIVEGQLVQGATDTGGEVGHHVLDPNGPRCGCGQRGCWEAYVGGRMVAERLKQTIRAGNLETGIVDKAGGDIDKIDMQAIEAAARDGDPLALREWDQLIERLAQGVGNMIMILNPEVIVLGTIAIRAGEFVMAPLREKVKKYAWKWPLEACKIVTSSLGGRIGDLSAMAVAITGLQKGGKQ